MLRFYNRSRRKLDRLIAAGKNLRKQSILRKRITRLFDLLTGVQQMARLGTVAIALVSASVVRPTAAAAQTFGAVVNNPFGLTPTLDFSIAFADLDNDGDLDLMKTSYGGFKYFENTGFNTAPAFALAQTNPFGLSNPETLTIDFADFDNDGDLDLITGNYDGGFKYFENTGTNAVPYFATAQTNPFGATEGLNGCIEPSIADLDNDGDLDVMMSGYNSGFQYFENIGSNMAPSFASAQTNPFGLPDISAPWLDFDDLDNDGDLDILVADFYSGFKYFENTGSNMAPEFAMEQTNPFGLISSYNDFGVSFGDLDDDGDMDLMSTGIDGYFRYFENTTPAGLDEHRLAMSIYPTVVSDLLHIEVSIAEPMTISVLDMQGRKVLSKQFQATKYTLEFVSLAPGAYMIHLVDKSGSWASQKVMKF